MSRGSVVIAGIVGVVLIWGAAVAYKLRPLQDALAFDVARELKSRGLDRRFENLEIDAEGREIILRGLSLSADDRGALVAVVASLPGVGTVRDRLELLPETKPFLFKIERGAEGDVTLSGLTPGPDALDKLRVSARTAFGTRVVSDIRLGRGAPAGDWLAAASLALELAALLDRGTVVLADADLAVEGHVPDDPSFEKIEDGVARRVPAGYRATARITNTLDGDLAAGPSTDAALCQTLFDRVMAGQRIRFDAGSAAIGGIAPRLLDRLAAAARRCGQLYLEVLAVNDDIADPAAGQRLSLARAQAVFDALAARGVPAARMAALSHGSPAAADAGIISFRVTATPTPVAQPYVWRISRAADGSAAIAGSYPSDEAKRSLGALARPLMRSSLADTTRLAYGVPAGDWLAAARLAVDGAAQLEHGEAVLSDLELTIRGRVRDDQTAEGIEATVSQRLPKGFQARFVLVTGLDEELSGPALTDTAACQALLDRVMLGRRFDFNLDGKALYDSSRRLFGRLVAAGTRCSTLILEVGAHTGAGGDLESDRSLSERWAQAIAEALGRAGARREQLKAVGYGNTRPLVEASSPDARTRNRRIEFRFVP